MYFLTVSISTSKPTKRLYRVLSLAAHKAHEMSTLDPRRVSIKAHPANTRYLPNHPAYNITVKMGEPCPKMCLGTRTLTTAPLHHCTTAPLRPFNPPFIQKETQKQ
ncbi:hypothetical protein PMIN02_006708 [Paraphaeosphaeria minitans]